MFVQTPPPSPRNGERGKEKCWQLKQNNQRREGTPSASIGHWLRVNVPAERKGGRTPIRSSTLQPNWTNTTGPTGSNKPGAAGAWTRLRRPPRPGYSRPRHWPLPKAWIQWPLGRGHPTGPAHARKAATHRRATRRPSRSSPRRPGTRTERGFRRLEARHTSMGQGVSLAEGWGLGQTGNMIAP